MAENKNPTAIQIGQRVKQARRMAGYDTAMKLLEKIPAWSNSRLGNYEAGISLPSPDHVKLIAEATLVSPCWLMFGIGPIRSIGRDLQAIRHQNFVFIVDSIKAKSKGITAFYKAAGLSRHKCEDFINNPFFMIPEKIVRQCEKFLSKPAGWMDEQHVESDPLCAAFPEEMQRLMEIYSNLGMEKRQLFLKMAEVFVD